MTTSTKTFTGVSTIAIPASDQDRTKELLERLGFETVFDAVLREGFRWISVGVPGAETTVSIIASGDELPTGIDTGIRLVTPDARAAHAELQELGLEVDELLDWPMAPLMFSFRDHDANRFYVVEPTT
jgi:hypothetical protein